MADANPTAPNPSDATGSNLFATHAVLNELHSVVGAVGDAQTIAAELAELLSLAAVEERQIAPRALVRLAEALRDDLDREYGRLDELHARTKAGALVQREQGPGPEAAQHETVDAQG
jgi:hypothetical protein